MLSQTFSNVYDHFGRQLGEEAKNIELTEFGYLVFLTGASSANDPRLGILGIDQDGNTVFEHEQGNEGTKVYSGSANSGTFTLQGTYILGTSILYLDSLADGDPYLLEIDSDGLVVNSYIHEDSINYEGGHRAFQSSDGSYFLVGNTFDNSVNENLAGFMIKLNSDFEFEWKRVYEPDEPERNVRLESGIQAHDGGFILSGRSHDYSTFDDCESLAYDIDPIVIKTDSDGIEEWRLNLGTCRGEPNAHIAKTSDGNYIAVSGIKYEENSVQGIQLLLPYVVKFDSAGQVLWQNTYGEPNYNCALTKTSELSDGNLINCGFRYDGGINTAHYWGLLIKIAQNGDSLWYRKYKFADDDVNSVFRDVIETADGGLIACGRAWPSDENPSNDTWVVKTDEYGCIIPGCHIGVEEFTEKYGRFKVGPNPISQAENLVVFLPDVKDLSGLSFQLRNLSGQLVKSFVPDEGGTSYLLRMEGLSKGMYVLSLLKDGVEVQTEKVVVK